jgi:hypothetical protein
MLAAQLREDLPRRLRAPALHIREPSSNLFDRFDAVKQRLVRWRVLDHEGVLAVDRQDDGPPRLSQVINHVTCPTLKLAQRQKSPWPSCPHVPIVSLTGCVSSCQRRGWRRD